jgi:hypothetical protein
MPVSFRTIGFGLAVVTMAILVGAPTLSHASTGSVRIIINRVGFIVGGGSGTLHFQGKRYELRVSAASVGPLGHHA